MFRHGVAISKEPPVTVSGKLSIFVYPPGLASRSNYIDKLLEPGAEESI